MLTYTFRFTAGSWLQVTVELISEPVPFPSVTFCNMRSLHFAILNRINELFLEDPTALSFVNKSLGNPFIESYMNLVARFSAMYYTTMNANSTSIDPEMVRALQEGITRSALYSYVPHDILSKAGIHRHLLTKLTISLHVEGRNPVGPVRGGLYVRRK